MKAVSALATLLAAFALALVVAYWGWQLFGPAVVHIATPTPDDPASRIVAANLFGSGGAAAPKAAPNEAMLPGDTRLLGIIAERDRGYALFATPGGSKLVAQGADIAPGVTLVSVRPDAITVRDAAGERSLVLRSDGAKPGVTQSTPPPATKPRAASASIRPVAAESCAPPAGFTGSVVRLNAELLGGLVGDAGPWRTLLASAPGGLVVRGADGFGAMLGLRSGDRITQANGVALAVPDDVASAVIRPLLANQGVRVVGSRAGTTHELWLANAACAG